MTGHRPRSNRRPRGDAPVPGHVYNLTGPGPSIANGNTWAASEVGPSPVPPPVVALDWHRSTEHQGLQGVAFPEAATGPEQGALL